MLKQRLQADLITAIKCSNKTLTQIARGLISEFKNEEIKLGKECNEPTEITILMREYGKYQEALQFAYQSGRVDSIEKATLELASIKGYLPVQLSEDEVKEMIQSSLTLLPSPSLGSVMKELAPKLKGKFDMKKVTELVKSAIDCRKEIV